MKRILIAMLALCCVSTYAQDKNIVKAQQGLIKKEYAKVQKKAAGVVKADKTQTEWWYLKAASEYGMSRMPKYQGGKVNYFKASIKSAIKAVEKDPKKEYYPYYEQYLKEIVATANKEAMSFYGQKRYASAVQIYRDNYNLTGDTIAYVFMGMSYFLDGKKKEGIPYLSEAANWIYGSVSEGGTKTYAYEPFLTLSDHYIEEGLPDSARIYSEMGLEVFPKHPRLLANEKELLWEELIQAARRGIDANFIAIVNRSLQYFPTDTNFLVQQNVYYLNQLENTSKYKPYGAADSAYDAFYYAKRAEVDKGVKNGADEFLIADPLAFNFRTLDYFLRTNTQKAAAYTFKKWYLASNGLNEYNEALAEKLLATPPAEVSSRMLSILYADAREDYPKNRKIMNYRLAYFKSWMGKVAKRGELESRLAMNEALIMDFPTEKILKENLLQNLLGLVDSTVREGNMYGAWRHYYRIRKEYSTYKNIPDLQKRIAIADFNERYANTRVDYRTVKTKKYANTGWDGNSALCRVGSMPDSTLHKIINRINYFRQNAGLMNPMSLSMDRVQKCQEAAVMFAGKGTFTREPSVATHVCFTRGGEEAASIGQFILESNPAQCVTVLMDDAKSIEMVNRRSILNPSGQYAGFGSAEDNSVFWLLDVGPTPDSMYYRTNFVAWPAPGYSPKMLAFKTWSFSTFNDVKDAEVEIKDKAGEIITVGATSFPIAGMPLQTLIIEPVLNPKSINAGDFFDVKVTLKNKKAFSYRVNFF